ncbi:MAG: sterol desaturase family protein [Acidimicrobiales bacterium]|nr:sterol desaturase family protein [Acidimicrobiales bacterium]
MLTPRQRSYALHGVCAALTLGSNPLDRHLQARGAGPGSSLLVNTTGWYALLFGLERLKPADAGWNPDGAEARTDGAFFVTTAVAALGGQALGAKILQWLRPDLVRHGGAIGRLGVVGGVVVSVLTSDFVHYSLHRLSHQWGPAWRVHSVHHSPEGLHILNASRFHPIDAAVEGVLEGIALGLFGFSERQHLAHLTMRSTYGQLQHCNIELDSGPIDFVMATPDLHRWHHSEVYAEGDNNYGAIVSVWDRLFGTFFRPERPLDSPLGVGRMPSFPQRFKNLLAVPFRWGAIKERNAETWYAPDNPILESRS